MSKTLLYFGCIRQAGHYLFSSEGYSTSNPAGLIPGISEKLLRNMDSVFPPADTKAGIYNDCVVPPVRIVSWWDYSVDKRPGSNSNLIGYGFSSAEEMIDEAYKKFPSVMNRQERPRPLSQPQQSFSREEVVKLLAEYKYRTLEVDDYPNNSIKKAADFLNDKLNTH